MHGCSAAGLDLTVRVSLEAEGSMDVKLSVVNPATTPVVIDNATLRVPYRDAPEVSAYMTGLGLLSENRSAVTPEPGLRWRWDAGNAILTQSAPHPHLILTSSSPNSHAIVT